MANVFLSFAFGACVASPLAAFVATMPIEPSPVPMRAAMYAPDIMVEAPSQADEPAVVEVPEVRIVGRVRPRPVPPSVPAAKSACRMHRLEQGGSPSAPFVLSCG